MHAPAEASGSLIKLLQSLEGADYFLSAPPRLTIELPPSIDPPTEAFLDAFRWPPATRDVRHSGDQLTLRHRIPFHALDEEEAAVRVLESFYPRNTAGSHLLVLSPQTELSPLYFHYLKYALLEYKYSAYASGAAQNMFGLSLGTPTAYLNDSIGFEPPVIRYTVTGDYDSEEKTQKTPFLWQAPDSNAALFFGDRWVEFHHFLGARLEARRTKKVKEREKLVSRQRPSWTEYLLELLRARGYYMLYPNFEGRGGVAAVHNELVRQPEEFSRKTPVASDEDTPAFVADPGSYLSSADKPEAALDTAKALVYMLPFDGDLPEVNTLPVLTHDGEETQLVGLERHAQAFANAFKEEIGGCAPGRKPKRRRGGEATDLFCLGDDAAEQEEEAEADAEDARAATAAAAARAEAEAEAAAEAKAEARAKAKEKSKAKTAARSSSSKQGAAAAATTAAGEDGKEDDVLSPTAQLMGLSASSGSSSSLPLSSAPSMATARPAAPSSSAAAPLSSAAKAPSAEAAPASAGTESSSSTTSSASAASESAAAAEAAAEAVRTEKGL